MQGIDLFSGAGGMSIGASMSGIRIKYAVELDLHAAATFSLNHKKTVLYNTDVRKVSKGHFSKLEKGKPLVLFGGPPCQGFSTSNQKNRGFDNPNNWLFKEYIRVVKAVYPDWVVFENVKGLIETENGFFLEAVLQGFKKIGYTTSHFVLNSVNYGVPQKRNRLFIVASLHGSCLKPPKAFSRKVHTVQDAIGDLPNLENGASTNEMEYSKTTPSFYARILRGDQGKCWNNLVTRNAPQILKRYEHIPQGGNWENIPRKLMKNYTDATQCHTGIYRRLKADEPSVVIGNFRKNMLVHPWKDRGLSVREAARLQSIPDQFKFVGSIGFQQQQVGNLVPPLLAKAVFDKIRKE